MIIVLAAFIIGALVGGFVAKRRKGNGFDIAQYAAVYAIIFGLAAAIATVLLARLA